MSALRQKANKAQKTRCRTLLCVLENPGSLVNVGAVIRNVDALGIAKLYIVSSTFKQEKFPKPGRGHKTSRVLQGTSAGASRWVYVHVFSTAKDCFAHLAKQHFVSVMTSPHETSSPRLDLASDFTRFRRLAIWFGNEAAGLSAEALQHGIATLQLPMFGMVESLNLAVCTGIVLHTVAVQRRNFSSTK